MTIRFDKSYKEKVFLFIQNLRLQLTKKELEVLYYMLSNDYRDKKLSKEFRKEIMREFKISKFQLSAYIKTFRNKGIIEKTINGYIYNESYSFDKIGNLTLSFV